MVTVPAESVLVAPSPGRVKIRRSAARLLRRGNADLWFPASLLLLIIGACYLGPAIFHLPAPTAGTITNAFKPVGTSGHLLGTDQLGYDVLSRCLFGGRISLELGFSVTGIGIAIGALIGVLAGYFGGVVDIIITRALDMFLAFPSLILILVIVDVLGPSVIDLILALSFFGIPANARIIRAGTLRIKSYDFVTAAKLDGRKWHAVIFRYILPNVWQPLVTFGFLGVGIIMLIESSLSFLGLGVPPPAPSWGDSIASGEAFLHTDPTLVFLPAAFLCITIVALNLLGDAMRSRWSSV